MLVYIVIVCIVFLALRDFGGRRFINTVLLLLLLLLLCGKIFKTQTLIRQLLTKYQISRNCPKFHIFTKIEIFKV